MEESSAQVAALVRRLVHKLAPHTQTNARAGEATLSYALQLLGSRMTPAVAADAQGVAELITKTLAEGEGGSSAALSFGELSARLQRQGVLREAWAAMYVLYVLRGGSGGSVLGQAGELQGKFARMGLAQLAPTGEAQSKGTTDSAPAHKKENASNTGASAEPTTATTLAGRRVVHEAALVRDVLFALQGIDGQFLRFDEAADAFAFVEGVVVPAPQHDLALRLCELGWLYRKVRRTLDEASGNSLFLQSLHSAVSTQLSDYYRLVAVLDDHVHTLHHGRDASATATASTLTLRRMLVWMQEPFQRLQLIAVLTDSCAELRGGKLASQIDAHAQHGDPVLSTFIAQLQRQVCVPLFHMIRRWMFEGELEDPHAEFFVACNPDTPLKRMWYDAYTLRVDMLPSFVSDELANEILVIGKSVNFIRKCCDDTEWSLADDATHGAAFDRVEMGNIAQLTEVVTAIGAATHAHLRALLFDRFDLMTHCRVVKRYLLLGQGDFIQYLMDLLSTTLSQPAAQIFRHNMVGVLETAIRASNAQFDRADVLERLDIRLLEPQEGDSGWDIFSLDYHVDAPIHTLFTDEVMRSYLYVFNFLWRLKRVECALVSTWRQHMTALRQQTLQKSEDVHMCHLLTSEMMNFITNFQYYLMFEVLEAAWCHFEEDMSNASDLDGLIDAHSRYMATILDKALLSRKSEPVLQQLTLLFDLMIRFNNTQEELLRASAADAERRAEEAVVWGQRKQMRRWGFGEEVIAEEMPRSPSVASPSRRVSRAERSAIARIQREYQDAFTRLLELLKTSHINLRFLHFRLDFNEYYANSFMPKPRLLVLE